MEDSVELFCLEDDETYERICGEIFLTTKKRVILHCSTCDASHLNFDEFVNHFLLNHFHETLESPKASEVPEEKPYLEEISPNLFDQAIEIPNEDVTIKLEIEPLEFEALKEVELPLSVFKEHSKRNKKQSRSSSQNIKKEDSIEIAKPTKSSIENLKTEIPDTILTKQSSENVNTSKKILQTDSDNEEFIIPKEIRPVLKKKKLRTPDEERKHKCPICGLGFKEKHNMRYHFRRHSNDKNHACPDCGKKFYTLSEVRVHRQFHTSKREFLCSDCGRAFRTRFQLTNHIKRHKNQRDFKCTNCDKAFFDNETLQSHMRVHTLERPFSCKTCNATFSRPTALRNHIKLHENKRAYKCNLCNAGFNQQAGLFSHMKVTHKAA